jgi:quinol monooxygenase YgiN
MRSDHGDRQALRRSDATPHTHQRELYARGSLWQRARHRIGQAHCVSERRKPQIKHTITNKDVEFHGSNDINVVIIATGDVCHEDLDCSLVDPFTHFSIYPKEYSMTKLALFVRLEAKPGQEAALADFLASALPLANAESGTTAWFALKFGPSTFGVFDAFADEAGRQAHLNGQIAAALMANAATLLSSPPNIEKVELLAAKLPA